MSIKKVEMLVRKNLQIVFGSVFVTFALLSPPVFHTLIHTLLARFMPEEAEILFARYVHFLIPFVITMCAFVICLVLLIAEERFKRSRELLFATPITTLEYLVSVWAAGFLITTLVTYSGIIFFVIINGFVLLSRFPGLFWLLPCFAASAWASFGVLLGLIWVTPGWIKKTLFSVIAFVPVVTLFTWIGIEYIPQSLLGTPEIQHSLTSWLVASFWLFLVLVLLGRKFEVRSFVR